MSITVKAKIVQEEGGLYWAECKEPKVEESSFPTFEEAEAFLARKIEKSFVDDFGRPVGVQAKKVAVVLSYRIEARKDRSLLDFGAKVDRLLEEEKDACPECEENALEPADEATLEQVVATDAAGNFCLAGDIPDPVDCRMVRGEGEDLQEVEDLQPVRDPSIRPDAPKTARCFACKGRKTAFDGTTCIFCKGEGEIPLNEWPAGFDFTEAQGPAAVYWEVDGTEKKIPIPREDVLQEAEETPKVKPCPSCGGTGKDAETRGLCLECMGLGEIPEKPRGRKTEMCPDCRGNKTVRKKKRGVTFDETCATCGGTGRIPAGSYKPPQKPKGRARNSSRS